MCNCGNKRAGLQLNQTADVAIQQSTIPSQKEKMWQDIYFEYTGVSALSLTGRITGKSYRFTAPGNIQPVDYRDAPTMMLIPVLKKRLKS